MTHLEETDNTTKNIVHEIVRVCDQQKLQIHEQFCTYYVKLLTLDPVWKISPERKLNRNNIQLLVSFIIEKLKLSKNLPLATLKMQQFFLKHCVGKENIVENAKVKVRASIIPLTENIKNFVIDETNKGKLLKRIVIYISVKSRLGDPKLSSVMRETLYALKSVFDDDDLIAFTKLKPENKLDHLNYLKRLVMGIKLLNHRCGRSTAEIEDLPQIVVECLPSLQCEVHTKLHQVMQKVYLITTALESVYQPATEFQKSSKKLIRYMQLTLPEEVTYEDLLKFLDFLVLLRENENFLRILVKELSEIEKTTHDLIHKLNELLLELKEIVQYNMGIPVTTIFPMFEQLATLWIKVQNECLASSVYTETYEKLNDFSSNEKLDEEKLRLMIGNNIILTDLMRTSERINEKIEQSQIGSCKVHYPLDMENFESITLEHSGYCIWSLVETNGVLFPGNPCMGIIEWKGKYYAFHVAEGALTFAEDPAKLINRMLHLTRKSPHLINVLQVYDLLLNARNIEELIKVEVPEIKTTNQQDQTELHPFPTIIDPNYVWNEWDLYRQAIKLANIYKYKTHSVQTLNSHFRSSVRYQTTEPRDKICQTKPDNYSNVATPQNFLFGLRGRTDDVQHIIDLTRPIDENHFWTCATANPNPPPCVMKSKKCPKYKKKSPMPSTMYLPKIRIDDVSLPDDVEDLGSCLCVFDLEVNNSKQT